jgi:hypothetical protein
MDSPRRSRRLAGLAPEMLDSKPTVEAIEYPPQYQYSLHTVRACEKVAVATLGVLSTLPLLWSVFKV